MRVDGADTAEVRVDGTDTPEVRVEPTPGEASIPPLAASTPLSLEGDSEVFMEPGPERKAGFYIGADDQESTGHLGQIQRLLSAEEEPMRSPRPEPRGLDPDATEVDDHRERKQGGVTFLLGLSLY